MAYRFNVCPGCGRRIHEDYDYCSAECERREEAAEAAEQERADVEGVLDALDANE